MKAPWEIYRPTLWEQVAHGGGKKGSSAPPAPDPAQTAAAQAAANKETAIAQAQLNMINQTDPFGNTLVFNQRGTTAEGTPQYEAIQTLSPEQKALADKAMGIYGQGLDTATNLFGQLQGTLGSAAPQYDETYRQQQLANILQRSQPQMDKDRAALETQLANQGITLGSQAYNDAMGLFNQRSNDLNLAADIQAGNEARAAYQTLLGGRASGINELTGLAGMGQVQTPSFAQTPQTGIANTDVIGPTNLAYQGQLAGWQAGQNRSNALMGGLSGLGGSALGGWLSAGAPALAFSDVRTKKNIEHIGYTDVTTKVPVYKYDYKWEGDGQKHTGVMAQELLKVKPEAVHNVGGALAVDYAEVK